MINKNSNFKWGQDKYEAFNLIKQAIVNAPSLATPNFPDPFILYTFASDRSYAAILTQANQEKEKAPIALFSSNLQGAELNYSDVEKQTYVVFKAIKYFRPFLLKTHTKLIVSFPVVRKLLVQKDVGEKRANWLTALQEYDIEIKPASIVKGQGFCKMLAGASLMSEIPSVEIQTCEKPSLPLQPVNIEQPFDQWGLDIIGEIVPHSSKQHKYILTATDYFTKWVEVVPLKMANAEHIIEFIDQFIITRFGLPSTLMFDNASYFSGNAMTEFALKRGFKLKYSASYYPQGNGLVESTNKNLIRIIKRTIDQNHKNWHKSLIYALWVDRITKKASIGTSPFNLVYGKVVVLPIHLAIPSLSLDQYIDEAPTSSLQLRQLEIIKLEEQREQAKRTHAHHQALVKASFDSNMMSRKDFQMGDLVLKWDKSHEEKGKHTKFQRMCLGPFQITEVVVPSTFML
eukprot:PITA_06896